MKVKLDINALAPTRAHETDAGLDLYSPVDVDVPPFSSAVIHTGVHVQIPEGCAGEVISKSGLNLKSNLTTTGLIDEGYTGEIVVKIYNHGDTAYHVSAGDKVTQLIVYPVRYEEVEIVESLDGNTARGNAGFGSTGR